MKADLAPSGESRLSVGILTFHRCINYGSYWQARCLVEGVRAMGADAVLLDHHSVAAERAELRCAFRPTLPLHTPRADFPAYARKTRAFRDAFARLPLSEPFPLDRPETSHDLVIVGSDEVWNLEHPWYGGCATFYGEGFGGRLASYAASFGNQDAGRGLSPYWAGRLDAFSALSVRDGNSRDIVRAATGREPDMVLDPCLQFPPSRAGEAMERRAYAVVYGHNFPGWLMEPVRRWARDRDVRLVSLGYRNDWADEQRLDADPDLFNRLMAGAEAVVTNFFHGCVFALAHDRPLITAPTPYRRNKVQGLMRSLGIEERILTAETGTPAYGRLLAEPADVASPLARLRGESDRFLKRVLTA
ncbi:polysaccharide pyruvyl transferase family protein [Sphingobium olei]|uniref:polysaccharide pyruvyl transferase family protein n=1 Tax=Sphingobium olei TaxID=420955 RepID=UPI00183BE8CB|nr:polysaccharide pyruvyl transferase family protein [Sphingobium sp.]